MFGKKNDVVKTALDRAIENKTEELFEANEMLRSRVEKVIIRKGVIDLYIEKSPDQNKAVADMINAKNSLHAAIGHYDNIPNELKSLMKKEDERNITAYWTASDHPTSHDIIENVYRNFFKNY